MGGYSLSQIGFSMCGKHISRVRSTIKIYNEFSFFPFYKRGVFVANYRFSVELVFFLLSLYSQSFFTQNFILSCSHSHSHIQNYRMGFIANAVLSSCVSVSVFSIKGEYCFLELMKFEIVVSCVPQAEDSLLHVGNLPSKCADFKEP